MLLTTVLVGLLLVGHYGAYTFITRLAEAPSLLLSGQVSGLLLGFGLASGVGCRLRRSATAGANPNLPPGRAGAHSAPGALIPVVFNGGIAVDAALAAQLWRTTGSVRCPSWPRRWWPPPHSAWPVPPGHVADG